MISSLSEYKDMLSRSAPVPFNMSGISISAGRWADMWRQAAPQPAVPTTAVVPTKDTLGAIGINNASSNSLGILGARLASATPGIYIICDRLSHSGGLSGTVATAQTTNLPTAALTRYTDGVGVMCGLTIYTAIGTTATTVSISYTNTTPTAGRVSPPVVMGSSTHNQAGRMILIPYLDQDTGIKSVESVTLTASTVSAAGNFGVTLFKPLFFIAVEAASGIANVSFLSGFSGGGIPVIADDACLFPLACVLGSAPASFGDLILGEF